MDVAERVGPPLVPPREVRRAADVVAEDELGDRVAEGERLDELRPAEVLADDEPVERDALGLHPADVVLVEPAREPRPRPRQRPVTWPAEQHVDRPAGELGEVLERADRVEVAVEHLLPEHGAAGEERGEAVGGAVDQGYWIPLTVLLVMRPETAHTYTRCVGRVGGICAGVWSPLR